MSLVDLFRNSLPVKLPPPSKGTRVRRYREGGGVESEEHRLLKEYVASNPEKVVRESGIRHKGTEYLFPTGDQADVVLEDHAGRIIGVEIEVTVNDGQLEGILQAIKYRYMLEPITRRIPGDSRAFLVAYAISEDMIARCTKYKVEPFVVPTGEVKDWAAKRSQTISLA